MARMILAAVLILLATGLIGCMAPRPFDEAAWRKKIEAQKVSDLYAPHKDKDGKYFNPWQRQQRGATDFFRWVLSRNSIKATKSRFPPAERIQNDPLYLLDPQSPPSITWVGHATYVIQMGGKVLVTDPFFSDRALLPKRKVPPAFGSEALPPGLIVLISHNHYDHLDEDSIGALKDQASLFICPPGLGEFLRGLGAGRVVELDWWKSRTVDGVRITSLPVQHWSRRMFTSVNSSLWASYLIEAEGKKVYFGADSGYFIGFREYGRRFPGIDAALIGVGAFAPRWFMHYAHMNPPEAIQAFKDLGARYLVPSQSGVLALGDEPASYPSHVLQKAADQDPWLKERLKVLPVGGRLMLE